MAYNTKTKIRAALLLALALTAAATSCGDDGTNEAVTTQAAETAGSGETAADTAEQTIIGMLPDADFGGEEFRVFGEDMRDWYTDDDSIKRDFTVHMESSATIDDIVHSRNAEIEERYNIKLAFEIVTWQQGAGIIDKMIKSGDNTYDLLTSTHLTLSSPVREGAFLDWREIPGVDLDKPYYVQSANETYTIGSRMQLLFGDFMESTIICSWVYLFNKQLAVSYDLPDPYAMVRSGEWTIDSFHELVRGISQDLNGDGKMDTEDRYGFASDTFAALDCQYRALGITAIDKDEDNLPVVNFWCEATQKAYEKAYNLYYNNEGVCSKGIGAFSQIDDMFIPGKCVFTNTLISLLLSGDIRSMEDDFGVLPAPKLDENQEMYYTHLDGTFSAQMVPITAYEDSLAYIGTITEALNAYSYQMVRPVLYDVSLKGKVARDEDSAEMIDIVLAGRRYSLDSFDESGFPFSPYNAFRMNLSSKKESLSSFYEKKVKKAEEWCEKWHDIDY